MISFPLVGLLVGPAAPLGPRGVPSGIAKSHASGPLLLSETGLTKAIRHDMAGPKRLFITTPSIIIPLGQMNLVHIRCWQAPAPSEKISPRQD